MAKILAQFQCQKLPNEKRNAKEWTSWKQVVALLRNDGHILTQIGGDENYECDNWVKQASYTELVKIVKEHDMIICNDSFCQHLNNKEDLRKPCVVLFSKSDPLIFGYPYNKNILKSRDNLRKEQHAVWHNVQYEEKDWPSYSEVYKIIKEYISSLLI